MKLFALLAFMFSLNSLGSDLYEIDKDSGSIISNTKISNLSKSRYYLFKDVIISDKELKDDRITFNYKSWKVDLIRTKKLYIKAGVLSFYIKNTKIVKKKVYADIFKFSDNNFVS